MGEGLIDDFIRNSFFRTILSVPFCLYHFVQYHFVRIPFCPYHFVRTILSATILSIPFCPYHFVRYHFVRSPTRHLTHTHVNSVSAPVHRIVAGNSTRVQLRRMQGTRLKSAVVFSRVLLLILRHVSFLT